MGIWGWHGGGGFNGGVLGLERKDLEKKKKKREKDLTIRTYVVG